MVTNEEFLAALFGADAPWVHVTDFPFDPNDIPKDQHLIAWKGDYFCRYDMQHGSNQYFTISNFYCDDRQQARRRKALFRHTSVIVLDDVKEKLSMNEVLKLPAPAWVLETSRGSEQWGYILDAPCTKRGRVENLLDGLVANGLAPAGKDPGMKGVTRYVRLPEGYNSKASKLVDGQPFKCTLVLWEPLRRVTLEQLARPFGVDLDRIRRETRVDGAADVSDHPILGITDLIQIKEVRSDGRFDITCPWVSEHTGADDSGSVVFTNQDGTIGFKCHHGACQERTGRDLLQLIEGRSPGFGAKLKDWQVMREFSAIAEPNFMASTAATPMVTDVEISFFSTDSQPTVHTEAAVAPSALQVMCDALRREHPSSSEARTLSASILKHVNDLPKIDQNHWNNVVCDLMSWGKGEFKEIIKDLRQQWYGNKISDATFYDGMVFVKEQNQFYEWHTRIFYSAEAFQNAFGHEDAEARKIALQDGRVKKVDKLDYAPKQPKIFTENGIVYANSWVEGSQHYGVAGDVSRWRDHFDALGWGPYAKHIIQWMAWTLRHPDIKINHMLLFGSAEGTGKDFILYPLAEAMRDNYCVIDGGELLRDFNDQLLSTKYLHINETELGDHREATAVSNKIKPLAASPPKTLRVNQKNVKPVKIRNILSVAMTTNSLTPVKINGTSRRIFGLWSDLNVRDENDNMRPEWKVYWKDRWEWIESGGWKNVAHHLMYEVDLSDFSPAEAPPMTDFLREIRESSKSPMLQTVEKFVKEGHGAFRCDIATASDLSDTLRAGAVFAPNDMYTEAKYFTPTKTGMIIKEIGKFTQMRAYYRSRPVTLWVLRNRDRYELMDTKELWHEYERQMDKARGAANLQIVK